MNRLRLDAIMALTLLFMAVFEGFYAKDGGSPSTTFSAENAVKEGTWENEFVTTPHITSNISPPIIPTRWLPFPSADTAAAQAPK